MSFICAIIVLVAVEAVSSANVRLVRNPEGPSDVIAGKCGGTFKNQLSGHIASPGFPEENYPNNITCVYKVHAPPGHVIAFSGWNFRENSKMDFPIVDHSPCEYRQHGYRGHIFRINNKDRPIASVLKNRYTGFEPSSVEYESYEFDLEDADDIFGLCLYDYVKLFDNNVLIGKEVQSYCGNSQIYKNVTTSNQLRVDFVSDFSETSKGFLIHWKVIDPNNQEETFNCSFDDYFPLCQGWSSPAIGKKNYTWHVKRGVTDTAGTGPSADHSTNSNAGRYAFIEASKTQENTTAILMSPVVMTDSKKCCLEFWYHMYGKTMGSLEVQQMDSKGSRVLAGMEGDHGNKWMLKKVDVHIRDKNTKFWFIAKCGPSFLSDIAIDDIKITEGRCSGSVGGLLGNIFTQGDTFMHVLPSHRSCPGNTKYFCAPACNLTCTDEPNKPSCRGPCVERCACPTSLPVWHDNRCIPQEFCPKTSTRPPKRDRMREYYSTILNLMSIVIPKRNE